MTDKISLIRVLNLKVLNSSPSGNPRYEVECMLGNNDKVFVGKTGVNSQAGYAIYGRDVCRVKYHFTSKGNLIITRVED